MFDINLFYSGEISPDIKDYMFFLSISLVAMSCVVVMVFLHQITVINRSSLFSLILEGSCSM